MISKAMLLLLGAILFLQGHNAAPNNDISAKRALEERLKLQKLILNELNDVKLITISESITALDKVLKDPKVLEIKSDLMKIKLDEIRALKKKSEDFEKKDKKEVTDYKEFTDYFQSVAAKFGKKTSSGETTKEDQIIAQSLEENEFVNFSPSVIAHLKAFTDVILVELKKYFDGLNEAEKINEYAVLIVIQRLKAESDTEKRISIIYDFLEDFELEKFLW